jgi:asparagine synthase (glutamine-hydrolysing)
MCGIVAIHHACSESPVERAVLERMAATLRHRGPDDEGYYLDGSLGLAHLRLAVIDLETGHQPMFNESGTVAVVLNGEIYNYRELRRELESRGHLFATRSDAETIVHLYEEHEAGCVYRLRGEFAFVIWDRARHRLVAARDRLGVRPLCYAETAAGLLLASEEKALLRHPAITAEVDPLAVEDYLFAGMVLPPRTMFAGVRLLPPGHLLVSDDGGVRTRAYWDVPFVEPRADSLAAAATEIGRHVLQAVAERLVTDVSLGACLSGGLDSSTVVACAAAASGAPLPTFTVDYARNRQLFRERPDAVREGVRGDDAAYAAEVARAFGTEHHEVELAVEDLVETLDRVIWHRDRPLLALTEHGHYHLYRAARPRATVLLSGEGGDEVFGGYYYWLARRTEANTSYFPWIWRSPEPVPLERAATAHDLAEAMLSPAFARSSDVRERLGGAYRDLVARPATADFGNQLGYLLLKLHAAELLLLEDRLSMAASVETRVPLLDSLVVEAVAAYPSALKIGARGEKPLLRDGPGRTLPESVRTRVKSPFPVPFEADTFYATVRDVLRRPALHLHRYVEPVALRRFVDTLETPSTAARRYAAFRLYTLERWHALHGVP